MMPSPAAYATVVAASIFAAAAAPTSCQPQTAEVPCRNVYAKDAPVETTYDFWHESYMSQTVYYLIADDGATLKVRMSEYHRTALGDWVCGDWRQP